MANAHRQVNQIRRIRVNVVMLSSEEEVRNGIVAFYQHLFGDEGQIWRSGLEGVAFDYISAEDMILLERPFTEEEILSVLRSMPGTRHRVRMVNLSKSELIPVGVVAWLPVLAAILGCKVAQLLVSYLGLPLGASFKESKVWDGVVDRVQRWLAGWKRQYLSKGGQITLIKNVLSNILTYFMSVHVIPVGVAKRLEKLQRDFL
ncbi:uncharacterized protein LOC114271498 [Camellia sinensis]|uniref:uncharacterized protein LOC114271498 n=1 Tax=Camellia sinensis TaxID=4442 RepID=UPI001036D48A|nr:uncharacterized protein LOC114271498 [Camellia sinensis]